MEQLRGVITPFVLRRLKRQVLTELPEKTEIVHHISLSDEERALYEANRLEALQQMQQAEGHALMQLLSSLTRLRRLCCSPALLLTDWKKSQPAVSRFQQTPVPLFLISLKAGGTGLNLTQADAVIHLDPWWNPAVEDQASGRYQCRDDPGSVGITGLKRQATQGRGLFRSMQSLPGLVLVTEAPATGHWATARR